MSNKNYEKVHYYLNVDFPEQTSTIHIAGCKHLTKTGGKKKGVGELKEDEGLIGFKTLKELYEYYSKNEKVKNRTKLHTCRNCLGWLITLYEEATKE